MNYFQKAGFSISILLKQRGLRVEACHPLCYTLNGEGIGKRLAEFKTHPGIQIRIDRAV